MERKVNAKTCGDAMTSNVISIVPTTAFDEAAHEMLSKKVGAVCLAPPPPPPPTPQRTQLSGAWDCTAPGCSVVKRDGTVKKEVLERLSTAALCLQPMGGGVLGRRGG